MDKDKEIRSDAKLKNLGPEALEELWRYRHPEEDGVKLSLVEILALLPERFGISSSLASLSEFYSWLRLKYRMEAAAARANQARLELARDPNLSPEDIDRAAQTVFTAETLEEGNVKGYVALARLGLARRALDLDARRLSILEAKAAQADQASAVTHDQALTEEEKAARIKQIFKMG